MEESTAEYAVHELSPSAELKTRVMTTVACKTDLGRVRENNEDKFEYYLPEEDALLATKGHIYIVCDGMGGHAAGQIASELAAKTFIDVYLHHPSEDIDTALRSAVAAANRFVVDVGRAVPARRGMGTTLSALVLIQDKAWTCQVGDSRIYRLRAGELEQLTDDHTFIEESVRNGVMSREEAEKHPYKHVLTRAIGTEEALKADTRELEIQEGDLFLLCSDGLLNHVEDESIAQHLREFPPSEATWRLVNKALAAGGSDNCTVMVVRVDGLVKCT